eukprot:CAMPEP_0182475094 /NCGR_PEP_ID=MMETSP1319-20130603/26792_1 /TAXON_ID=172717 /ORGANISM="Bolidomonas pacifica, Strain RCC208" /LENGTH=281 /DNA_ID=CAMNT_0024676051 /DNA_START=79 /DNA_END=920 /DNA_ORIENTATION=+
MVQGLINAFMDGVEIMGVPTMSLGRRDEIGRSPLHFCGLDPQSKSKPQIDVDCARIISMLIEAGFDPNAKCKSGWSPLDTYATLGLPETVSIIADNPAVDLNSADEKFGKTALMRAAINGNFFTTQVLLDTGRCDINLEAKDGGNALYFAVRNEVMSKLGGGGGGATGATESMEAGAMEGVEEEGTASDLAALLEEGIEGAKTNFDEQCSAERKENEEKAVDLGCEPGKEYMKIIDILLSSGADVNSADSKGKTSIMLAASSGHLELVKVLLQFNVDLQKV